MGAAIYSPAKYGILSELTSAEHLVKANGLMEGSTIAAILLGVIAGGALADWNVLGALIIVAACYATAAAANLLIPKLPPAHALARHSFGAMLTDFRKVVARLFSIRDARFSLVGTSLFWGAGSTMRFLLIAWVPVALGISNNSIPAYLNGVVAIGIVVGAALAARFVTLANVDRALSGGIVLGLAICAICVVHHFWLACAVLVVVGAGGGFFVVPLNALLQEKGHESVGAGHAVAVQNLAENTAMLVMIAFYILLEKNGAPPSWVALGFGGVLFLTILGLLMHRVRNRGRTDAPAVRRLLHDDHHE